MHLALSALDELWDRTQPILFLGEWCLRYDRKEALRGLDYTVMSYPWDDREQLALDYGHLKEVYEEALVRLSRQLNAIHGTAHSLRFWRIVIGPWLNSYIEVLYERFLCLRRACEDYRLADTSIVGEDAYVVPNNYRHFLRLVSDDAYNMVLYSQLVRLMGAIEYRVHREIGAPLRNGWSGSVGTPSAALSWKAKQLIGAWLLRCARGNRIAVLSSLLKFTDHLRLQGRLRQWPTIWVPTDEPSAAVPDHRIRSRLSGGEPESAFERVLCSTIPMNIPLMYVEEFGLKQRKAQRNFPERPKLIVLGSDSIRLDLVKFWVGLQAERGTTVVGLQQGGSYGSVKWSSDEDHEIGVVDQYYSWGWTREGQPKVVSSLAFGLLGRRKLRYAGHGRILCVGNSFPRYSNHSWSCPVGPQQGAYIAEQIRFLQGLEPEARRLALYRLYPQEYGWREDLRLRDAIPSLDVCRGGPSMYDQMEESRLFIGTYNSTTYLEAFAANHPTIVFWCPRHWEIRPSAEPYFRELREVGVLHDSPEAAAVKVNEVYRDPRVWWDHATVQKARQRFCERFARTSEQWFEGWSAELKALSTGAREADGGLDVEATAAAQPAILQT